MKILWCIVFNLVFNDLQTIASKLQIEKEDTNPLINLIQRIDALEIMFEENMKGIIKMQEGNNKKIEALEKTFEEKIKQIEAFVEFPQQQNNSSEKVDCGEKCKLNETCTSAFWSNSSDSECRFNHDKSTLVKFVPGEFYYCKDCQTTLDLVFDAEYLGVIKLANVASNKMTQASSYANAMSDPSKAVDGDLNTWFSSEAFMTKGEPWLMVDLGQRFLVAQIKIHVRTKPFHKITGGYFKVCLVDAFNRTVNLCNQQSEILKMNRRLRGYSNIYDMKKVIMGRYLVVQKLEEKVLEIAELEVLTVNPIMSYECPSCLAETNTVCDESRIPPVCTCADNHLPVDGEATNGCKDPCLDFNEDNAKCDRVDHETRNCSCNAGYHPVNGDPCKGCNDPCDDFGERNSLCSAIDAIRFNCSCEQGFVPVHDNEPCQGCKKIVCPSSLSYKNYGDFGCLKAHKTWKNWEDARFTCKNEGGDLFIPGDELPLLPEDEMNLGIWNYYSIGIRSIGNGPFERINSGAKLDDDSKLWTSGQPHRQGQECVIYSSGTGLLYDNTCTKFRYFICEMK